MALTDAQAKIIAQNKKQEEEAKKKVASASNKATTKTKPSTMVYSPKETKKSGLTTPLDYLKSTASSGVTTQDRVTVGKSSGIVKNAQKSIQTNKETQAAKSQIKSQLTLSESDLSLPSASQKGILDAKLAWEEANKAGDKEGMAKAHADAEKIRSRYGYSGGVAGDEKIEGPGLTAKDKMALTNKGQQALLSALTLGDKDRAEEIRKAKGFQKEDLSRRVDAHDRTLSQGAMSKEELAAAEKRLQEGVYSSMAGVAGSLLSVLETGGQALKNANRKKHGDTMQEFGNRVEELEAKLELAESGNGDPSWGTPAQIKAQLDAAKWAREEMSSATIVDPNLPGQTLLRESREAAGKALEGQSGLPALLTKAGMSAAQMLPGIAASFIPGVGPAVGLGIMGAQAAGSKMGELNEQSSDARHLSYMQGGDPKDYGEVTPGESFVRGVASGVIEALTGKIPLGNLLSIVKKGGTNALVSVAKQAGIEGVEESVSYLLNYYADDIAGDPNAQFSPEEMAENALIGAISGAGFASGGMAINSAIGKNQQKTGQETLLEAAGVGMSERQQNEQEQTFEQPQQETPAQKETPAHGQERGETARESLERRKADLMARYDAVFEDPNATQEQADAMAEELTALQAEQTQLDRQEAGQVSRNFGEAEGHIDNRTAADVSARNVKAFQFDHPQLHQYYSQAAEALKQDAEYSFASQRSARGEGTLVQRSEQLARAEGLGLTRQEIVDACDAIINDKGQENYAAAKKVELILDEMLTKGYLPNDSMGGEGRVAPDEAYIQAKQAIPGAVTGFDQYLRDNSLALELGETTEEELRAEFEAMGAMSKGGAGAFASWQAQTPGEQFHPVNEEAAAVTAEQRGRAQTEIPTRNLEGKLTSKVVSTFANANIIPNEMVLAVESNLADGAYSRIAYTDAQALQDAEAIIQREGYQGAKEYWLKETAQGRLNKANSTLGIALINRAANSPSLHTDAMDLLAHYAEYAKSAGQALQAMNMINKLTPQGQLYSLVKTVEFLEQRANKNGGDTQLTISPELTEAFLDAETQEERNEVKQEIIKDVAAQMPNTWRDRFDSWRYLAMLGNPRTHIRNIVGNAGFAPVRGVKNVVGAGLEKAVGTKERTKAVLNRLDAEDRARLTIARGDFAKVEDLIMSGGKYMDDYSQINRERDVWKSDNVLLKVPFKMISKASNFNAEMLDKEDRMFSKPAYAGALAGYLKANGITAEEYGKMLEGDTRKVEAREYAIKEAQKATYRDTNAFSEAISSISKMRYSGNKFVRDVASPLAEGVLPFKKTPANILMRTLEYSPVGLGKGVYDAAAKVRKGEVSAVEAIDEIASGLTGTGLLGLGMLLGHLGLAVGGASGDDKQDDFNELQGHQNYALEIGNRSFTLDWLAPEALPFFVGVELQKAYAEAKGGDLTAADLTEALGHIAEPMLEMSMLQGLNDLFNTLGSDYPLSSAAWTAATSYLTQLLPTLAGQLERTFLEDTRQTTFVDRESGVPVGLQYLLGNVGNKIPVWDYNQVDYVDAWGRKEETGNLLIRAFNNLLNPSYTSKIQTGSTESELQRLYELGYDEVFPGSFQKSAKINDKYVTADQWVNMQTERGKTAKSILDSFLGTEQYKAMSDDEKAKFVKKVLEYASSQGKAAGGADTTEFDAWINDAKAAEDAVGLSEGDFIALYTYKSVLDDEAGDETTKSIKQGMFEQYIDSRSDLTDEQKSYVKDNVKFWNMVPADASAYNKAVEAGYTTPESITALLSGKKEYDFDGNSSYTNTEMYAYISSLPEEEQEKAWNALKSKGTSKSWATLKKEEAPKLAKQQKAQETLNGSMDADRQTVFANAVSEYGTGSRYAVYQALMSIDATDAERQTYYNYVNAKKGWKASWAQMKANGGYP